MNPESKIYVAGHRGLVGSAILRRLEPRATRTSLTRTRSELDLTDAQAVDEFFAAEKPEYVFLAAAKVGGILANDTYPADFLWENLLIELNVIDAAHRHGVKKLLFLGSSCIYPKFAPQPMKEEYLLTGRSSPRTSRTRRQDRRHQVVPGLQPAVRRATSSAPCRPTSTGPATTSTWSSHVLPALIRKFHEAKESGEPPVTVWGTGTPRREFLHVDDLADACVYLMDEYSGSDLVNVGVGEDISIGELAELVRDVVGYAGRSFHDTTKPDGTPRKLLDVSKLHDFGWRAKVPLSEGIERTYAWFLGSRPVEAGR